MDNPQKLEQIAQGFNQSIRLHGICCTFLQTVNGAIGDDVNFHTVMAVDNDGDSTVNCVTELKLEPCLPLHK